MSTPTLAEAVAARAKARERHGDCVDCGVVRLEGRGFSESPHSAECRQRRRETNTYNEYHECYDDHRTAAERAADALAACADLAAYWAAVTDPQDWQDDTIWQLRRMYDAIQRRAGGDE